MQQVEFALSAMNAMLLCHSVVFTCLSARARSPRGGSYYIYELVQPQIIFNPILFLYKWDYLLFKLLIFLKLIFSKMKNKNSVSLVKIFFTPQNEP
jgi:hypothetical protein